ncbi:hypothetical protein P153DRAFT_367982 [Dothidotthia symphoricarpi CBS 119687]|uniref:Terpenoid synthase n=1 Tax=Dothidotthia symphoricarpi CBS 119687 TaxID=1392245 RepID=A0A6A6AB36_9PLEO|nr:uncharacterized protein P153DRAFT_367982 [Dothidotthia symphoricarpi CBS 119687]KAF2128088.1 hypothetical protein P153DRAFT_367982 [Dothidotthia symphoricarpi CBS 119687]
MQMIIYFVFDNKIEESEGSALSDLRNDFFGRFDGPKAEITRKSTSPLQQHLDDVVSSIYDEDAAGGNGGHGILQALRSAFRFVHPEGNFFSVQQYLEFRQLNVGASFVIAAAKFTIKSGVDESDPRFARYLTLVGDHVGLVNDCW